MGDPLRIGVMGLGRMGLPIARRLRAEGHVVAGIDLDPTRVAEFGARVTATPPAEPASDGCASEVAGELEVLVTVLPGAAELGPAMLGDAPPGGSPYRARRRGDANRVGDGAAGRREHEDLSGGALAALPSGALWIDLTSGDPRVARKLATVASEHGVLAVGAPMAGGPADAEAGTLGFFVGGEPGAVERALPLLHAIGDPARLERAGVDVGAGHVAKLLANTLWFGQVAAVVEALLIGQAQGIEPEQLAGILRRSAGGSAFLDRHLDALLDGDYLETFGIDRVVEELDTVTGLAADAGLPIALTRLVAALHHEALERFGPVDGELLVAKLLEEHAGTRIRRPARLG
jgi:3-hydroxyisobutyrate dehydrogenase-like beta-hydroxyacid dehydrogenase